MKSSPTRRRQGALLHESSPARKLPRLKSQLDDRDAHPPAMRWLFGEYTAAEAGNRTGLGRPTRRGGGAHLSPPGGGSGTGSLFLHYFSTNRVDSRRLRWTPVDSTDADKRSTSNALDQATPDSDLATARTLQ